MLRAKVFPGIGQVVLVDSERGGNAKHTRDKVLVGEGKLNGKPCWIYAEVTRGSISEKLDKWRGKLDEISKWAMSEGNVSELSVSLPE